MADMRSRMAALRARRAARVAEAAKSSRPKCADPELLAAAEAAGTPKLTWDADYRQRLAGTVQSSDDEDEAIVVLPPPAVKLDPVASRVAWRKNQRAAARAQAVQLLRDRYPAPAPLIQPKPVEMAPKEDVDDEEQLLIEDENAVESDEEEEEGNEEEEVDEENQDDCEQGNEEQEADSVRAETDICDVEKAHTEVDGTCDAETQPPQIDNKAITTSTFDANAETQAPETAFGFVTEILDHVLDRVYSSKKHLILVEEQQQSTVDVAKNSRTAAVTRTDDSQRTAESSRATLQLAAESSNTVKSIVGQVASSRPLAPVTVTSGSSDDKITAQTTNTTKTDRKAVTVSSGRALGPFTKLGLISTKTSKEACTFIDNEAEDEMEFEFEVEVAQAPDSDEEEEDEVLGDDGIEPDSQQTEGDAQRLAEFHREWQKEADGDAVVDTAKALGCERDVEEQNDLAELLQRKREREEAEAGSDNDDAASFCMGGHPNEQDPEEVDNYVDNMFRDENSRNEYHEEAEIATPEDRKKEARALWKARRRHQAGRNADPNAISLLTLFDETEEEVEATAARFRAQIIRSTTAPKHKTNKRKAKEVLVVPEWQLRREALAKVEKRRRTAISLMDFSYNNDSFDDKEEATEKRPPRMKEQAGPPVGTVACLPTVNVIPIPMQHRKRVQAEGAKVSKKRKSSLLLALGEKPRSDM